MKLKELIELSGGFEDSTFLKSVYSSRGELIRRNPKTRYESVIEIDIMNVLNGLESDNIELNKIKKFEKDLLEKVESEQPDILENINSSGKLEEDVKKKLISIIEGLKV